MGLEINAFDCLIKLKNDGANIKNVATIGRQCLHVDRNIVIKELKKLNINLENNALLELFKDGYCEKFLNAIGVHNVDSFDYSDYEKCSVVHDMNKQIGEEHKNKYDVVFDGGTLEHVFNFPVAVKNCMEMVKVGGYFVSVTVCNNYSGHGFYQFSPELFFRIFSKVNGFKIDLIYIDDNQNRYLVTDPEVLKARVEFQNTKKTFLVLIAKKIENKNIFETTPLQSDYSYVWKNNLTESKKINFYIVLQRILIKILVKISKLLSISMVRSYNKKMFKKIKK